MTAIHNRKALRIVGGKEIPQPTFEATFADRLIVKRFLDFALADIFQFDQMSRTPGATQGDLQEAQGTAVLLSNYVKGLRDGVEAMTLNPEAVQ